MNISFITDTKGNKTTLHEVRQIFILKKTLKLAIFELANNKHRKKKLLTMQEFIKTLN